MLPESELPTSLTADWHENEENAGTPFPSYASLLQARGTAEGDSALSWTVDFAARRAKAQEEMQPLREQADAAKAEAIDLKEQLKRLKKHSGTEDAIEETAAKIAEREKSVRELEAQIAAIDEAVYDLKAVNPNAVVKFDERTVREIIDSISEHGKVVSDALTRLNGLLASTAVVPEKVLTDS